MSLTQQSERAYKGRDCKNGHKFVTSCLILGNQKGYERQDCTSRSPIRHFVPHPWQSKSEGMDCEMSSANRWIANSALCASSGNQEMAKQLCEGVPAPEQYHVTGTVRRSIDSLNFA